MNIGDVGNAINVNGALDRSRPAAARRADEQAGNGQIAGAERPTPRERGGGLLVHAVAQTLSQLGLGQVGQVAVTAPSAAPAANGDNTTASAPTNNGQNVGAALHAFVHTLFQALNPGAASSQTSHASVTEANGDTDRSRAKPPSAIGAPAYTPLSARLQGLAQNLTSGETSSAGLSALNDAFQKLQQAVGANAAPNANAAQTNLPAFLQGLAQNLQHPGNHVANGVGTVINTSA